MHVEEAGQHKNLRYDSAGEEHYNQISALHKSLRDSDPDGALYWLSRMLTAGEDHVALGSDFDGSTTVAFDTSELAVLTQKMMDHGFSDTEIAKVMGGNSVKFLHSYLPN